MLEQEYIIPLQCFTKQFLLFSYRYQGEQVICHVPEKGYMRSCGYKIPGIDKNTVFISYLRHNQSGRMTVTDPYGHAWPSLPVVLYQAEPAAFAEGF